MKKLLCLAAAMAISTAAHATKFEFSWNGDYSNGGNLVTGTFEGTASGNLITDLSNISVFINGQALNGNGSLYGSSYNQDGWYGWVSGGAQASFNGLENNFLFIDADYPNSYNYTNYFYSVLGGQASYAQTAYTNWNYSYVSGTTNAGNWSVNAVGVPEPTPLALFGLGLLALARFRSKKSA